MGCGLSIPEACFSCPFPDCINNDLPQPVENSFIKNETVDNNEHNGSNNDGRKAYLHEYHKNLTEKQKERKRAKNREWMRAHYKEIYEKRKEYMKAYYKKRKAAKSGNTTDI